MSTCPIHTRAPLPCGACEKVHERTAMNCLRAMERHFAHLRDGDSAHRRAAKRRKKKRGSSRGAFGAR